MGWPRRCRQRPGLLGRPRGSDVFGDRKNPNPDAPYHYTYKCARRGFGRARPEIRLRRVAQIGRTSRVNRKGRGESRRKHLSKVGVPKCNRPGLLTRPPTAGGGVGSLILRRFSLKSELGTEVYIVHIFPLFSWSDRKGRKLNLEEDGYRDHRPHARVTQARRIRRLCRIGPCCISGE